MTYAVAEGTVESVSTRRLAELLDIPVRTLESWRLTGDGPNWIKLQPGRSGLVRYRLIDVAAWLEARAEL